MLSLLFIIAGCGNELDNYEAPDGGISGQIIDAETGQPVPLPVEGSSGVIVNLYELGTGATKSVDFYAKADGSYANTKVFNGQYRIVVNGPFVDICSDTVVISGQTRLDLKCIPYSRIKATASVSGRVVTINYAITPTRSSDVVSDVYGIWNISPGVDNSTANCVGLQTVKNNTNGSFVFDLDKEKAFASNAYKIQANGNKVYFRIGAKVSGKVNYSTTMEVTVH
jgi:hypothetical protein